MSLALKCLILLLFSRTVNLYASEYSESMVFVKGGVFVIGNSRDKDEGYSHRMFRDKPAHQVTVNDFYISRHEITQDLFEKVVGTNPSRFKGARRPVERVTWYQAVEFCNRLSERDGLTPSYVISGEDVTCDFSADGYRLLTEAEWEYAARGGHLSQIDYLYAGSNNADEVAWNSNNSGGETHDVGKKQPNELGLYDLSGNVSEWCWDWFAPYQSEAVESPTGPSNGTERVERGGNWRFSEMIDKNTRRHFAPPDKSYHRLGFRIGKSK
jgi:sulfatase modifying factor 1